MKALVYNLSIPKYLLSRMTARFFPKHYFQSISCLSLKEVPIPEIPSEEWARVKVTACGICGSDLNLLLGKDSFSLEPYSSFPAVLGHETIGVIEELGKGVAGVNVGDRVAIENILPCITRNIEPVCANCQNGDYSLCLNFRKGSLAAGPVNGYNSSTGGGFAKYIIAHKSQLFKLPDTLSDDVAVLTDALASALQPAAVHLPKDEEKIVVYGGGIIGILLIGAIRALGSKCRIISITRYNFQSALAKKAGANDVINRDVYNAFAELTGSERLHPSVGKSVFDGGVNIVFDCVGSSSTIDNSLRFLKPKGKLVIVGSSGNLKNVDSSPIWFREITVTGSSMYSNITINGKTIRTYAKAIELLATGAINTEGLVTHRFQLKSFERAIQTAIDKKHFKSSKVVMDLCAGKG